MNASVNITRNLSVSVLLTALLAGCGIGSIDMLFVKPGAYDYFSCADLAKEANSAAGREQELKILIERAEQEPLGMLIAAAAYRTQYLRAQGEQKAIADIASAKNCPPASVVQNGPAARQP